MRKFVLMACLGLLVGCADAHKVIPDAKYAQTRLSAEGTAYIALPADGSYGKIDYEGSGAMVAQMIQAALLDYMVQVDIGPVWEKYATARNTVASSAVSSPAIASARRTSCGAIVRSIAFVAARSDCGT